MNKLIIVLTITCLALPSYSQSKLTRSYRKADFKTVNTEQDAAKYVQVSLKRTGKAALYKGPSTTSVKYGLLSLDTGSRKQMIKAYSAEVVGQKDSKKSITDLFCYQCSPKKTKAPTSVVIDLSKFAKTIVFDINDYPLGPQEKGRIASLYLDVELNDLSDIELVSFANFNSKEEIIDFGKINLSRTRSFNLTAGVDLGGTGANTKSSESGGDSSSVSTTSSTDGNLAAGFTSGRTVMEERNILKRRIAQKGTLYDQGFMIYQEGAPGKNLNDKLEVQFVFQVKNTRVEKIFETGKLFDKDGNPIIKADKLTIKHYFVKLANDTSKNGIDIGLNWSYKYVYREVTRKAGRPENEHHVTFAILDDKSLTTKPEKLLNTKELRVPVFSLVDKNKLNKPKELKRVFIRYLDSKDAFKFLTNDLADNFLTWLILSSNSSKETEPLEYKGFELYYGTDLTTKDRLTKANLKDLIVSFL